MTGGSFDRVQIRALLAEVDTELVARGLAGAVYVVGGAAIALRAVSDDRRTADVDALMAPGDVVREAAEVVARRNGLRPDWLNARVAPWVPPMPGPLAAPSAPGLAVSTADSRRLLAMKLVAARGWRDMKDVVALAADLDVAAAEDLVAIVLQVYGEDMIEAVHGGVDDLRLTCSAAEREILRTREGGG